MGRTVPLLASLALAVILASGVALVGKEKPANAAFPGKNGDIAFYSDREGGGLFRMNPDGTGVGKLSDARGLPAWSPNGKALAVVRDGDIYLMKADGSNQTKLTSSEPGYVGYPHWAPSGRKIVYTYTRPTPGEDGRWSQTDLYAISFDTSWTPTGPPVQLTNDPEWDEMPAVSPDGKQIAFFSYRNVPDDFPGGGGIYVMDADRPEGPDNQPILISDSNESYYMDLNPNWSPDGTKIVYEKRGDPEADATAEIWMMNPDGSGDENLTTNSWEFDDEQPVFSPDGTTIIFSRRVHNADGPPWSRTDLWKMNADGSGQVQLTNTEGFTYNGSPDWQPLPSPRTRADCTNGGYKDFSFKNQGLCMKAVEAAS